ncbi:MAG TPA: Gfo/Idh/MocA family oxidoreductase [Roseiflexaceae bacterium]|nr:Gfo/Idh/MocA family oxidoreductase [Roseiflexaceae bacterium]
MQPLRFAIFGTGFWSRYQLAAWRELAGAECVALYNRTRSRAEALAAEFGITAVYDDPHELLRNEQLDFIDIISDVDTHRQFVELAAAHGIAAICQKPMAPTLADAEAMAAACRAAGVPLLIHENFRWQTPLRAVRRILDSGVAGRPFRARIDFNSGFPVFNNQPFLARLEQFIITDLGSHILDIARFLFGEAQLLFCQTDRIHADIAGEDVATIMTRHQAVTVVSCMAYAGNHLERECFPQTLLLIECEHGSIELAPDYIVRVSTADGTHIRRYAPPRYPWANPAYELIHSSIVPCHADLLQALRGEGHAETTAEDNLRTLQLVFASYESAASGHPVFFS